MMRVVLAGLVFSACVSGASWAQTGAAEAPATQPASTQAAEPRVSQVLQALEKRGESIKDLEADVEWVVVDTIIDDRQAKLGQLYFKRGQPQDTFLIRFDKTIIDDMVNEKVEEHLFDGRWYVEKREATKSIIKREIVRPGEEFDPFKLGQGPFPLPFGQKASEILAKFDVTYVEPKKDDPAGTAHLKLVPKETVRDLADKYNELHFYIDRKMDLPVKVVADQKDDKVVTVTFRDIKVNTGLPGSRFVLQLPEDDPTWSLTVESLPPQNP